MMKKSTLNLTLMALPAMALTLAGCGQDNRTQDNLPVAEPVVQELSSVCTDGNLKARLDNNIKNAILDSATGQLVGLAPEELLMAQNALAQRLGSLRIDTQNPSNFADSCMADIAITLDTQDLAAAEYAFAQSGMTLLQRANQDGVQLNNNTVVAKQVTYQLVNGDAVMYGNHNALRLVADILLAASAGTQSTLNAPQTAEITRPQVIERVPTQPATTSTERANGEAVVTTRIEKADRTQQAAPRSERPVVHKQVREIKPENKEQATKRSQASNEHDTKASDETARQSMPSQVKRAQAHSNSSETANKTTASTAKKTAETETKNTNTNTAEKAAAKPASKPADSKQPDNSITIVESNETY